ncbi:MAG TPA: peptidoglycan DD-metalloendopeptidase family protein [Actinomycetota bacterium]|nr:peptidoglycan DD-metalloendopeptidase family protein [Actinomycetota bacterium]
MACVGALLSLVLGLVPVASAVTRDQVEEARARVQELRAEIRDLSVRIETAQREANRIASRLSEAQAALWQTRAELRRVRGQLGRARDRYEALRARLEARAREAFIVGPGTAFEFLLGASSLADLSDRLEFIGAVAQTDAELAVHVDNLRNELAADAAQLEQLRERQADQVRDLRSQRAALARRLAELASLRRELEAKAAEARDVARDLSARWQRQLARELAAATGSSADPGAGPQPGGPSGGGGAGGPSPGGGSNEGGKGSTGAGIFRVCPVGDPHALSDSFGAPRVGHIHAGVDIFAPYGTPVRAPFDGVARASTNDLGGYSVYVYGSEGYVYNAHLARPGRSGPVQAGDVIGYVGNSGNARGTSPHDHFEWHPDRIPTDWPASPYGYAVIGDAVNPYPLLVAVC